MAGLLIFSTQYVFRLFTVVSLLCLLSAISVNAWANYPDAPASSDCNPTINAVYAAPSNLEHPSQIDQLDWQAISLPDIWSQRWPGYTGVVWYRLDWQANCSVHNAETPLALLINSINMAGKIWVNQHLLWSDAHLIEPLSRSWNTPRLLTLPSSAVKKNSSNHLFIRVSGDAVTSPGLGLVTIDDTHEIAEQYDSVVWNQRTIFYINIILSITLGMICTCIWLFRRKEVTYGWYSLTTVFWVLFISNTLITETAPFSDTVSLTKFNVACFILYTVCFCVFSWRFLDKRYPRTEQFAFFLTTIMIAAIYLAPIPYTQRVLLTTFYSAIVLFSLNSIFVAAQCFRTRQLESWLLGITLASCLTLSTISLMSLFHMLGNISIVLPYTSLVFAIFLCIILALRLTQSLQRIESFNDELSQKILEAEQKLELTLNNRHQLTIKNHQLNERLNLAHELHDGLGGSLVRAMMEVSHAKQNISNKHTLSILSLLRNDLRQIIDSFSESHTKLPENPIYWLAPLRNRFIQVFDDMDIRLQWEVDREWVQPPSSIQCLTLYRVAEEALTNIIKHSQATEVVFYCHVNEDGIELQIIDNGIGFDAEDIIRSGIGVGMRSMRARIERLAGILTIQSKPGETKIIVQTPYEPKKVS